MMTKRKRAEFDGTSKRRRKRKGIEKRNDIKLRRSSVGVERRKRHEYHK